MSSHTAPSRKFTCRPEYDSVHPERSSDGDNQETDAVLEDPKGKKKEDVKANKNGKGNEATDKAGKVVEFKQEFAFKVNQPNSMTFDDMEWCPNTRVADIEPVDDKLNFLFLLGVQKSGTTWLHRVLTTHPLFVDADMAFGYVVVLSAHAQRNKYPCTISTACETWANEQQVERYL